MEIMGALFFFTDRSLPDVPNLPPVLKQCTLQYLQIILLNE